MGTIIALRVGNLEIDWGKNNFFKDHSPLYQSGDIKNIPYFYYDDQSNIISEEHEGLSKSLCKVCDRIDLLGYSLEVCEAEFIYLSNLNNFDINQFTFNDFKNLLHTVDVTRLSLDYGEGVDLFGRFFERYIFPRLGLQHKQLDPVYVKHDICQAMENISPYTVLQLLRNNPSASCLNVEWCFHDLVESGWAEKEEISQELVGNKKFLIVTEGSSDSLIIKHAFNIIYPHVSDFFDYVDMSEGYPFSGVGSLVNFVKGLVSISIQNKTIVLFDNDAEGESGFVKCQSIKKKENIEILKLPDLDDFLQFQTVGPSGESKENINGRGAAIECYLDIPLDAAIRWTNYNSSINGYHGALINKDEHKKKFLDQNYLTSGYNFQKIKAVLDMLIEAACKISSKETLAAFRPDRNIF